MQRKRSPDAMRAHYDFSTGKRGAFLKRFPTGVTLIALDEDVRKQFPTAAAVNKALRSLVRTKRTARRPKPSTTRRSNHS
jgi:hypothetical protein